MWIKERQPYVCGVRNGKGTTIWAARIEQALLYYCLIFAGSECVAALSTQEWANTIHVRAYKVQPSVCGNILCCGLCIYWSNTVYT